MDAQTQEIRATSTRASEELEALLFAASEPLDQKPCTSLPEGATCPAADRTSGIIKVRRKLCCVAGNTSSGPSDLAFLLARNSRNRSGCPGAIEPWPSSYTP